MSLEGLSNYGQEEGKLFSLHNRWSLEKRPQLFTFVQRLVQFEHLNYLNSNTKSCIPKEKGFYANSQPNPRYTVKCYFKSLHRVSILETYNF